MLHGNSDFAGDSKQDLESKSSVIAVSEMNLGQLSQQMEVALSENRKFTLDFSEILRAVNLRTDAAAHLGPHFLWSWQQNAAGEREPVCLYHPTNQLWEKTKRSPCSALLINRHGGNADKVSLKDVQEELTAQAEHYVLAHSLYLGIKLPFSMRVADESGVMLTGDDRDQIHDQVTNDIIRMAAERGDGSASHDYLQWISKIIQVRSMLRTVVQLCKRIESKEAFIRDRIMQGGEQAQAANIERAYLDSFLVLQYVIDDVRKLLKEEQQCRERFYNSQPEQIVVSRALDFVTASTSADEIKQNALQPHSKKVDFVLPNGSHFSPREVFLARAQEVGFVAPIAAEIQTEQLQMTIDHLIANPEVKAQLAAFLAPNGVDASAEFAQNFLTGIEENFVPVKDGVEQPNPKIKGTVVKTRQSIVNLAEDGSARVRDVFTWGSAYDHTLQLSLTVDYEIDLSGNMKATHEQIIVHNPEILAVLPNLKQIPQVNHLYGNYLQTPGLSSAQQAQVATALAQQSAAHAQDAVRLVRQVADRSWTSRFGDWVSENRNTLIIGLSIVAILCLAVPFLWPVSAVAAGIAGGLAGAAGIATGAKLAYDQHVATSDSQPLDLSIEAGTLPQPTGYSAVEQVEVDPSAGMAAPFSGELMPEELSVVDALPLTVVLDFQTQDAAQAVQWRDLCSLIHTVGTPLPVQVQPLNLCPPEIGEHFRVIDEKAATVAAAPVQQTEPTLPAQAVAAATPALTSNGHKFSLAQGDAFFATEHAAAAAAAAAHAALASGESGQAATIASGPMESEWYPKA